MPIYPSVITGTVAHKHESSSATGGPLDVNSITLATGLTEGGIIQGDNGTGLTNLSLGNAAEILQVNAGATALEYVTSPTFTLTCADTLTIGSQTNTICKWLELGA